MTTTRPRQQKARALAVFCAAPPPPSRDGGGGNGDGAPNALRATPYERPDDPDNLLGGSLSELTVLNSPTLTELRQAAERVRPTHVYVCGAFSSASAPNPVLGRLGPLAFKREEEQQGGTTTTTSIGGNGDAAEDEEVCAQVAAALAAAGPQLQCVYLDVSPGAAASPGGAALAVAEELQRRRQWGEGEQGAADNDDDDDQPPQQPHPQSIAVVGWPGDPPAALASHLARAFFSHLSSSSPLSSSTEAYGVALLAAGAVAARGGGGAAAEAAAAAAGHDDNDEDGQPPPPSSTAPAIIILPRAPDLLLVSAQGVSDAAESALPDARSVPRPRPRSLPAGVSGPASVPGWAHAVLLAPKCEVRLRVAAESGGGGNSISGSNCDLAARLGCLGEGLRALLAAEVRALQLVTPPTAPATAPAPPPLLLEPLDPSPCPLPSACQAVRAHVRTRSGAVVPVVAVLPELVIAAANGGGAAAANGNGNGNETSSKPSLARLALRHALLADALALQLLLPPLGAPMPRARARADVAGGLPGADCLARTSVWAAALLRCLALGAAEDDGKANQGGGRALASLGVTAVGCAPVRALCSSSAADVERLYALVVPSAALAEDDDDEEEDEAGAPGGVSTALRLVRPTAKEILAAAAQGGRLRARSSSKAATAAAAVRGASTIPRADPPTPNPAADDSRPLPPPAAAHGGGCPRQGHGAASLADCPDDALAADLAAFLNATGRGDGPLPQPLLGTGGTWRVSLPLIYRAVASRGGFRAASAINWRGQVLTRCCFSDGAGGGGVAASLRLAAAGHALKRLYASLLWDYERAHPADVSGGERCPLCGRGDDDDAGLAGAGDWLACDGCDAWVHYSCDRRTRGDSGALAPFEAYENEGRQYFCAKCGGGAGGGGGGGVEAAAAAAVVSAPVAAAAAAAPSQAS